MSRQGFNCLRCGHCCLNLVDAYRGCVSDADLTLWRQQDRTDILSRIETLDLGHGNLLHCAWLDPETGDDVERCPWLCEIPEGAGFSCGIEGIKPEHCRNYPEDSKHAEETGCRGYSPSSVSDIIDSPETVTDIGDTHG